MKNKKFKNSTRFLAITIALLTLVLSLPLTAFAADEVEPRYTIIHTPDGGTISTDPAVKKVDDIPNYLFEDPLGSSRAMIERMERSSVTPEDKGSYTTKENRSLSIETPYEAAGAVSWSVSNPYLASVDSAGTVYVTTAGAFYVLANFTDDNGNARCFKYNILIELQNGVYKFKNKSTNYYIELPAGNITDGTRYIQWREEFNRNSEFKITSVGTGLYTIRSMVVSSMGFKKSGSYLVNSDIGTSDSVSSDAKWMIASTSDGYYIYNSAGSTTQYTLTPYTSSENSNIWHTYYGGYDDQFWSLIPQAANEHGVELRSTTDDIEVGDSFQFTATLYSAYPNVNGQNITWSISGGSGSISNGLFVPTSAGLFTITAKYTYNSSIVWSDSCVVKCVLPLSEYELDYNASLWSSPSFAYLNNCYAYAINNQVLPGTNSVWFLQQPGAYGGNMFDSYTQSSLYGATLIDFQEYNDNFKTSLSFTPIDRFATCPAGTYKVALVAGVASDGTADYHWYRQDSDGLWSHKRGTDDVQRTDNLGNLIYDPYTADRGGYTQFLGYYAVSPWNNMLNTNGNIKYYCSCTNLEYPTYEMFYAHYLQNHS